MKAKIYKPSKSVMQSGRAKTSKWVLECEAKTAKIPDDVMGWVGASDTDDQIKMLFSTKELAISFAEKEGWDYSIIENKERVITPRSYADNFKYEAEK